MASMNGTIFWHLVFDLKSLNRQWSFLSTPLLYRNKDSAFKRNGVVFLPKGGNSAHPAACLPHTLSLSQTLHHTYYPIHTGTSFKNNLDLNSPFFLYSLPKVQWNLFMTWFEMQPRLQIYYFLKCKLGSFQDNPKYKLYRKLMNNPKNV